MAGARTTAQEPKLTRDQIVATARALLAEVGVEGLTMRRLGQACGMSGPALYWHFKDKDDLVGHIVDSVVGDLYGGTPDQPWPERLLELGRSCRSLLVAHPGLAVAVASGYTLPERVLVGLDDFVGRLTEVGFTHRQSLAIHYSVLTFTIGYVIYEGRSPTFATMSTPIGSERRAAHRREFEEVAGDRLPHLGAMAAALEVVTVDEVFDAGLGALIQGWADRLDGAG